MKTRVMMILLSTCIYFSSHIEAGTTGKLVGRVMDAVDNKPIPAVNIFIEGTSLGAFADLDGNYFVINIPPGKYNVLFRCLGYSPKRMEGVRINVDVTTNQSVQLSQTTIEGETMTVLAAKDMIQKDLTSTSARVSSDDIKLLPLENVAQIVNLQAGVVNGHFRGGRLGEVAYMIDGLLVNDAYTGGQMINLEANSIAEVEVISGTFNAEYGSAMSGVVNIVSKEPTSRLSGMFSTYTGAFLSNRAIPFVTKTGSGLLREDYYQVEKSYNNLARFNDVYDIQGNISGSLPIFSDKLFFFTSYRKNSDNGYLYGKRLFLPSDSSYLPNDRSKWRVDASGDGQEMTMDWAKQTTAHAKLIGKPISNHKLTYEFIFEDNASQQYIHRYKYNPNGRPINYEKSFSNMLHYDYVIGKSGFINFKYANLKKEYESYLYENPYDLRYVPVERLNIGGGPHFYMAGNDMNHSFRRTTAEIFKADMTYQFGKYNQIKTGIEGKLHDVYVHDYTIRLDRMTDYLPRPIEKESPNYNEFSKKPREFSLYFQDKIEWDYLIMNMGLRYDWFDPDGIYPSDLMNPTTSTKLKASIKSQWSPRFGIALPVTAKSVLHLSYGLFFQIPSFYYIYLNPLFKIPVGSFSTIGNTDLRPQKTATYEIGLQMQVANNVAVTATTYYKDIRNLLGMEVYTLLPSFDKYARYVNRDYGQVFGFTLALEQRASAFLTTTVDYTYQLVEGNSSDPKDVYLKSQTQPPTEITKQLIFLDWDRTHSLNFTATVHHKDLWNMGIIGKFGSGFPYTPETAGYYPSRENDERKPYYINFDANFALSLQFFKLRTTLFANIYNMFDIKNDIAVFLDTGKASYSIEQHYYRDELIQSVNTVSDYYYNQHYFSPPRKVVVGIKAEF